MTLCRGQPSLLSMLLLVQAVDVASSPPLGPLAFLARFQHTPTPIFMGGTHRYQGVPCTVTTGGPFHPTERMPPPSMFPRGARTSWARRAAEEFNPEESPAHAKQFTTW